MTKKIVFLMLMASLAPVPNNAGAADCGWVLWENNKEVYLGHSDQSSKGEWKIRDGFETLHECNKARRKLIDSVYQDALVEQKKGSVKDTYLIENGVHIQFNISNQQTNAETVVVENERFYCLPGTLDPREHK